MAAEQPPAASWGADTDGRLNQSSEHLTEHAMLSTDASGNTVLLGPNRLQLMMRGTYDVRSFGARVDGVALYDATTTASTTCAIHSDTGNFSQSDVGKICVIIPYTDSGQTPRRGTIASVSSPTDCVATLNVSPGALTGATFIYGTDDQTALNAALASAASSKYGGTVTVPVGILCTKSYHVVPTGTCLEGVHNNSTGGGAKDFRHYGSSIVSMNYDASHDLITLGDTVNSPKGTILRNINIDCIGYNRSAVSQNTRTTRVEFCTLVRGLAEVYIAAATSNTHDCTIMGQNQVAVLQLTADCKFTNNLVMGAGIGYYAIKISNGDDILVANNHIWKSNIGTPASNLGGQIQVVQSGGSVVAGSINILGNKFDSPFGPQILIDAHGSSTIRGVNIVGNIGFTNDAMPNATYPFISLLVEAGSTVRGLNIQNNLGRGSWNDPTKGQYTAFIDGTGVAGNIYGSNVGGNVMDNCAANYIAFTPDIDGGNISIAGTGTTLTKSVFSPII